jgi:hypothetical protein
VPKVKKGAAITGVSDVSPTGEATKVAKAGRKVASGSQPASSKVRAAAMPKPGRTGAKNAMVGARSKAAAVKPATRKAVKKVPASPRRKVTGRGAGPGRAIRREGAKGAKRASAPALKRVRGRKVRVAAAPVVRVVIRALDPYRKCGPGTSVQHLYRVDEQVDGRVTHHLVFFDRHGWYCEHGRACPAVAHARKYKGQIARVS